MDDQALVRRPKISWDNALWMDVLIEKVFEDGYNKEKNELLVKFLESAFDLRIPLTTFKNRLNAKAHKRRIRGLSQNDLRDKLQKEVYNLDSFPEVIDWLSQRSRKHDLVNTSNGMFLQRIHERND